MAPSFRKYAEGDLPRHSLELLRLLHAVDTFPQGGLTSGYYAAAAAWRYETIWIKVIQDDREYPQLMLKPPLDVAFAWFVHRQEPSAYAARLQLRPDYWRPAADKRPLHPSACNAFGFSRMAGGEELRVWSRHAPGRHAPWPPPAPGSHTDPTAAEDFHARPLVAQLVTAMHKHAGLLHSLLRPCYLDGTFLAMAQQRYAQFMQLHTLHPGAVLVPTADIALMWHTHMGLSGRYAAACAELFGERAPSIMGAPQAHQAASLEPGLPQWRPSYLDLPPDLWWRGYMATKAMYESTYGQLYDPEPCRWVPLSVPHPLAAPATSPLGAVLGVWEREDADGYEAQRAATAMAAAGVPDALCAGGRPGRCGGHALFTAWVMQQEVEAAAREAGPVPSPGLLDCCRGSPEARHAKRVCKARQEAARRAARRVAMFPYFEGLPHSDDHGYWGVLQLRDVPRPAGARWQARRRLFQGGAQAKGQGLFDPYDTILNLSELDSEPGDAGGDNHGDDSNGGANDQARGDAGAGARAGSASGLQAARSSSSGSAAAYTRRSSSGFGARRRRPMSAAMIGGGPMPPSVEEGFWVTMFEACGGERSCYHWLGEEEGMGNAGGGTEGGREGESAAACATAVTRGSVYTPGDVARYNTSLVGVDDLLAAAGAKAGGGSAGAAAPGPAGQAASSGSGGGSHGGGAVKHAPAGGVKEARCEEAHHLSQLGGSFLAAVGAELEAATLCAEGHASGQVGGAGGKASGREAVRGSGSGSGRFGGQRGHIGEGADWGQGGGSGRGGPAARYVADTWGSGARRY